MEKSILDIINQASIESRIEIGYRYWVNSGQLFKLKPIIEQVSIYDYGQFGAVPLSNLFVTREERDENNKRVARLFSYVNRTLNLEI